MTVRTRKRPLVAATALGLCLAYLPAHAAEPAAAAAPDASADDAGLVDIVVTAQKRPESLQSTPISISVMSNQGLEDRHVVSLLDLGDGSIPGLKIAPFYARASAVIVNIRGVGVLSDGNQPARDQGVGVYTDGVYMGRAQGLGAALMDVDSIEVLKGPQGTLFGRNTEGGAVSITTKKPTGELGMTAKGGVGNYGSYNGEIHLNLPSWNNVAFKVDGVVAHRDALVKNPLASADGFGAYDRHGVHAEALWTASPNFTADYSYDNSYDATTSQYLQLVKAGTNIQSALGTVQSKRARTANVGVPEQPSVGKVQGHRLTLSWEPADNLTIKSISSYRKLTQTQYDNGSAATSMSNATGVFTGANFSRYSLAHTHQDQESQELQIIGEIPRVKYAGGLLYYREHAGDDAQAFYTGQFTNADGSKYTIINTDYDTVSFDRVSHVTTQSLGAFGQATYNPPILNDIVHLTGGLRWTKDAKHGQLTIVNGLAPVDRNNVSGPIGLDKSWSRVDPMVNLMVDVSNDVHVYGKWSTGYKAGGANSRSQEYDAFNPETVSMFEIGAKTEFFDRHARFNIAAYAGSYKDIQVDFSRPYETGGVLSTTRTTTSTINAPGTGGLHGVEAELTIAPVTGLTLTGSAAYQYVNIPATVNPYPDSTGATSTLAKPIYATYTPKYTASAAIDYETAIGGMTLHAHLDGNYDDGYYVSSTDVVYKGAGNAANLYNPKTDSSFIVNGSVALSDIELSGTGAKLTLSVWSRNLFNEQHLFYKQVSASSGTSGLFNEPRTIGVQGQVKF